MAMKLSVRSVTVRAGDGQRRPGLQLTACVILFQSVINRATVTRSSLFAGVSSRFNFGPAGFWKKEDNFLKSRFDGYVQRAKITY